MANGSSFGIKQEHQKDQLEGTNTDFLGNTPKSLVKLLPEDVQDEINGWYWAVVMHSGVLVSDLSNQAQMLITTAAANDALGLIRLVDNFEGRAAAFTARSLFEHAVNLREVSDASENTPERFLAHKHIAADRLSRRTWILAFLDKRAQRKEKNKLDGLQARTKRYLEDAIARYGSSFQRGWASGTLADRARKYDLEAEYDGYRILSGVVHGSSGGMRGLVKTFDDRELHRIGPDMDLTVLAYEEGLAYFHSIAETLVKATQRPEADEILGRTAQLLHYLQEVRSCVNQEDKKLWPKSPLPELTQAVLAVYPKGKYRWYIYDLRDNMMALAETPSPEPDISFPLEQARHSYTEATDGRPLTTVYYDARIVPRDGARWIPAGAVLVQSKQASAES